MIDPKKIAEKLGAEPVGHVEAKGGAFGAAQTVARVADLKAERSKPACHNCGKRHPQIVFHDGHWWCPGACDVTRKRKT